MKPFDMEPVRLERERGSGELVQGGFPTKLERLKEISFTGHPSEGSPFA